RPGDAVWHRRAGGWRTRGGTWPRDRHLDPPIELTAGLSLIACHRLALAHAACDHTVRCNALLQQGTAHGVGAALRQAKIVVGTTSTVGKPLDRCDAIRALLQERRDFADAVIGAGLELGSVHVEEDSAAERQHAIGSELLAQSLGFTPCLRRLLRSRG